MASPLAGTTVVSRAKALVLTFPVTIPAGSDRFLGVSVHLDTGTVISSVTYSGSPMTLIRDQLGVGPGGRPHVAAYGEIAPPVGTANVVITLASSVEVTGVATPWTGVDQPTGFNNATGAAAKTTTPTIVVTSAVGDEVVDAFSFRGGGPAIVGAGQTVLDTGAIGTGSKEMGTSREAGAAAVTMDWTLPGSDDWAIAAYNLIAAVVTPPADPTLLVVTCIASNRIDGVWVDNAIDEVDYRLERESPIGGGFTEIQVLPADSTTFVDMTVLPLTQYNYRVRACKSGGVCSGFSNEDDCTTLAGPAGGAKTTSSALVVDPTNVS